MTTDAQGNTTSRTVKHAAASATAPEPESRPAEQRREPQGKAGATQAKPAGQQARAAPRTPPRRSYHTEIAALADSTAELPPPWCEQTIRVVHAIVALCRRAWRELRRRSDGADVEVTKPTDDAEHTVPG
jgi:hypothetical protein